MAYLLSILFPVLLIRCSMQSECLVSEWGTWSTCHGGCEKGLIVRNRDVLHPPLQEWTQEGRMMQRLCPHLYETKYCDRTTCGIESRINYKNLIGQKNVEEKRGQDAQTTEAATNFVEQQRNVIEFGSDRNDQMQNVVKKEFISETDQLLNLDDAISRRYGPQPSDSLVNTNTPIIDISTQQMTNKQWKEDMTASGTKWTSPTTSTFSPREHPKVIETAVPTHIQTDSSPASYTRSHSMNNRKIRLNTDHSVSNLLRKIEQALDSNQPLDEKYIKSALRRNRKLSKLLVDAYRQRQKLIKSGALSSQSVTLPTVSSTNAVQGRTESSITSTINTTTQRAQTIESSTKVHPAKTTLSNAVKEIVDNTTDVTEIVFEINSTTTSSPLYWPKTLGYVPNTRKHASEITAQLYMTNGIVQTLADDPLPLDITADCEHNKRCCKIIKNSCSDGIDPKFVKRWYRPKGSPVCVPYHYPRCSSDEEMEELPILFKQNCQDICFSQREKRIDPLFMLESEDE